jgi:hypothetical protein
MQSLHLPKQVCYLLAWKQSCPSTTHAVGTLPLVLPRMRAVMATRTSRQVQFLVVEFLASTALLWQEMLPYHLEPWVRMVLFSQAPAGQGQLPAG